MSVTNQELEAACRAFHPDRTPTGIKVVGWDGHSEGVREQCRIYMRMALEAAESVRRTAEEAEAEAEA